MSVHPKAGIRRRQVVLQVLLFATGFLASVLGLPRLGLRVRMSPPPGRSERPSGADHSPLIEQPPKTSALATPGAAPPLQGAPPPAAPGRPLFERLGQLREILLGLSMPGTIPCRTCTGLKMLQSAGLADHRIHHARESIEKSSAGGWKELVDAVQVDRLSFLSFLRDPVNEPIVRELLYLGSNDFYDSDREHCLERTSALLEGFLSSGTKLQKLAVMDKYRGAGWHGDVAAPLRRRLTELYSSLLSDPDPEIRGDALRSLLAHDSKALEPRMAEVRGAWPASADVGVQLQILTDLSFLPIPEAPSVHSFLVEKVRGLLESDDAKIRLQAAGVLDIVVTRGESDALGDCASVLACAFKGTRDPEVYRGFLETSVRLPMAHLGRILGDARASAPTPELQRATENVLHAIKGGETRSKALLRILDDALGASTRIESVGSER